MRQEELINNSFNKMTMEKERGELFNTCTEKINQLAMIEDSFEKMSDFNSENCKEVSDNETIYKKMTREELIEAINHCEKRNSEKEVDYLEKKKIDNSKKNSSIQEIERLKNILLNEYRFINVEKRALYVFYEGYFQLLDKQSVGMFFKQVFEDLGIHVVMKRIEYLELLEQLKIEPSLYVKQEECRTNEDVIVFENGTLNVRTLNFSPTFSYDDFQFSKIHYNYPEQEEIPDIEAEKFLDIFCDYSEEMKLYLWELVGYLLSNYNQKIIVIFYGPGNSGKSTLANFVKRICGSSECVGLGVKELSVNFNLAELQGKRLCIDSEMDATELNARDIRTVKRICGNDLIQGNRKYERQFYFIPTAKLLWCTNNPIVVQSGEDLKPFLNRLCFFQLRHEITPEEWIPNLDSYLDGNRGYFLWCAMEGLHRLVTNNFVFSSQICSGDFIVYMGDSHKEYVSIGEFVDCCCELVQDELTPIGELYSEYLKYAEQIGKLTYSNKAFSQYLVNNYYLNRKRTKEERLIEGIRLIR